MASVGRKGKGQELHAGAASIYVGVTEKLLKKLQMNKDAAQREVTMSEHKLLVLEQRYGGGASARAAEGQGALYTKCHNSTSGHDRARCTLVSCTSVTIYMAI